MKIIAFDVGGTKIRAGIVEGDKVSGIVVEKTNATGTLDRLIQKIMKL